VFAKRNPPCFWWNAEDFLVCDISRNTRPSQISSEPKRVRLSLDETGSAPVSVNVSPLLSALSRSHLSHRKRKEEKALALDDLIRLEKRSVAQGLHCDAQVACDVGHKAGIRSIETYLLAPPDPTLQHFQMI
jgi:hypothetical protein